MNMGITPTAISKALAAWPASKDFQGGARRKLMSSIMVRLLDRSMGRNPGGMVVSGGLARGLDRSAGTATVSSSSLCSDELVGPYPQHLDFIDTLGGHGMVVGDAIVEIVAMKISSGTLA